MRQKLSLLLVLGGCLLITACNISGTVTSDGVGLERITITLDGETAATTQTDSNGNYIFEDLDTGTYMVTMKPPAGYTRAVTQTVKKSSNFRSVDGIDFSMTSSSIRTTNSGQVIGQKADNGSHAWLGIPYASPPVGSLRWKAPIPPNNRTDTYLALEVGNPCPQIGTFKSDVPKGKIGGSEDCLYLNIWSPEFEPEKVPTGSSRLPVMLWIHGGSNTYGHGGLYFGQHLAKNHNLVVISFNYRLGPLGWLTHPALESGNPYDDSGNYGTLDVIRILHWIQNNISNFGGDPNNVMVFGESAGGGNTFAMIISREATGLFHKAASHSAGLRTTEISYGRNYVDDPLKPGHVNSSREIISNLLIADGKAADRIAAKGVQNAMTDDEIRDYLYGKTADDILNACGRGRDNVSAPTRFRDGVVIPKGDPYLLLEDTEKYNAVPIILGSNRDEDKLYTLYNPEFTSFISKYPIRAKDSAYYALHSSYKSDAKKIRMVESLAEVLSKTPGQPDIYAYRFDWDEIPKLLFIDLGFLLGASHGMEIAFVFNNFDKFMAPRFTKYLFKESNLPSRKVLAGSMSSYWAEFAYSGSPGFGRLGSETVEWTAWDSRPGGDKSIVFDSVAEGGNRMTDFTVTWEELKKRLISEKGFTTQEQHCKVYVELFSETNLWDAAEYAALGTEGCGDFPLGRGKNR